MLVHRLKLIFHSLLLKLQRTRMYKDWILIHRLIKISNVLLEYLTKSKKNFNKVIKTLKVIKLFQYKHLKKEDFQNFCKIKKQIQIYKIIKTNNLIFTHRQQVSDNNLSVQAREIHYKTKYTLAKMKLIFIIPHKIFAI